MNIGIVTTWFERGAAYVSKSYCESLQKEHNVFIYARGGESYAIGDPKWDGDRVTWGKRTPLSHIIKMEIDYKDFKKWVTENSLDIVFFNEQRWWNPVLWCKEFNVKTGAYIDYYTEETIPLFANYDFLICNTQRHYRAFEWHPQAFFVPWGVDLDLFKPTEHKRIREKALTFFHSAGMSPYRKGTDLVISAFSRLSGESKLIIHSQKKVADAFPDLSPLIEELESEGRLIFYEKSVSAPGLYHLGCVYVYPSRLDGLGLSLPEAMACGMPAIFPDIAPMNEFFDSSCCKKVKIDRLFSRYDGYYWPQCESSIENLQESMQFFVHNFDDIENYRKNAREYAIANLDIRNNFSILPKIFSNISFLPDPMKKEASLKAQYYESGRMDRLDRLVAYGRPYLYSASKAFKKLLKI